MHLTKVTIGAHSQRLDKIGRKIYISKTELIAFDTEVLEIEFNNVKIRSKETMVYNKVGLGPLIQGN